MKNFLILLLSLYIIGCGGGGGSDTIQNPDTQANSSNSSEEITVNINNKTYYLLPEEFKQESIKRDKKVLEWLERQGWHDSSFRVINKNFRRTLPAKIDRSAFHTSIKDQSERGTCTSFAVAAALEARYKQDYNLTLDLNEHILNHYDKMTTINNKLPTLPITETYLGTWGGAYISHMVKTLTTGLSVSNSSFYIPDRCYGKTDEENDTIKLNWDGITNRDSSHTQANFDQFNLNFAGVSQNSSYLRDFGFPSSYGFLCRESYKNRLIPYSILSDAKYAIERFDLADENQLDSLTWYKNILASGYDIIFGVDLFVKKGKDINNTIVRDDNGVWKPIVGDKRAGAHTMVMLGYDDNKSAFIIKNSWGGSSVDFFSYDWVKKEYIYSAYVIKQVSDPSLVDEYNIAKTKLFGRWHMWGLEANAKKALDWYHLPGLEGHRFSADLRVGTIFDEDGAYRINGILPSSVNRHILPLNQPIRLWFDKNRANLSVTQDSSSLSADGVTLTLYPFNGALDALTGYKIKDGIKYGVVAMKRYDFFKLQELVSEESFAQESDFINVSEESLKGTWLIVTKNYAIKAIINSNSATNSNKYEGYCYYIDNLKEPIARNKYMNDYFEFIDSCSLEYDSDNNKVTFSFNKDGQKSFSGYFFENDATKVAGKARRDGFFALRVGKPELILNIKSPTIRARSYLLDWCSSYQQIYYKRQHFIADILNGEFYDLSNYDLEWYALLKEEPYGTRELFIGKGNRFYKELPYGKYKSIEIFFRDKTTHGYLDTLFGSLVDRRYCFEIVNVAPEVTISSMSDGAHFCVNQDITLRALVSDLNELDINNSRLLWSTSDGNTKVGNGVNISFSTTGSKTVTATYQDDGDLNSSDSVTITIDSCIDTPPTLFVSKPAQNSALETATDRYSDNTEDRVIDVDFVARDNEDGSYSGSDIVWKLRDTTTGDEYSGNYSEVKICIDITPFGCGAYGFVKKVTFNRVPSCVDWKLIATITDSGGNSVTDEVYLRKPYSCNLK